MYFYVWGCAIPLVSDLLVWGTKCWELYFFKVYYLSHHWFKSREIGLQETWPCVHCVPTWDQLKLLLTNIWRFFETDQEWQHFCWSLRTFIPEKTCWSLCVFMDHVCSLFSFYASSFLDLWICSWSLTECVSEGSHLSGHAEIYKP